MFSLSHKQTISTKIFTAWTDPNSRKPYIRFEGGAAHTGAQLKEEKTLGCYTIEGDVFVKKQLSKDMQVYIELKYNPESDRVEPCVKANEDGCGGYGSW